MARRREPMTVAARLGLLAGVATLLIVAAGLAGLVGTGELPSFTMLAGPYLRWVVLFSLWQATLSTSLSIAFGAALALALARRPNLPLRQAGLALMATAATLPSIVVVFAMVAVYGRAGWLASAARLVGFDMGSWLYGLPGILIAHVFMNAPLCARVFLPALQAQSPEAFRLATHLGLRPGTIFRLLDLPVLRREAPALAALVFLMCFASFAVVLALGGGPDRATIEVAIFEALKLEADFARAASLALLQVLISGALTVAFMLAARRIGEVASAGRPSQRPDSGSTWVGRLDTAILVGATLFLLPPLASVLGGVTALPSLSDPQVARAAATSAVVAVCASLVSVTLAVFIASGVRDLRSRLRRRRAADLLSATAYAPLAMPSFSLVVGLFGLLHGMLDPAVMGPVMVVLVNAMMALPVVIRLVQPPLMLSQERHGRLADSLGMRGVSRLWIVDWPLLRRPLLSALSLGAALSLGDFGVVAFFGTPDFETLPLLLFQRLGAYRIDEAGAVALLLATVVFVLSLTALWRTDARPA